MTFEELQSMVARYTTLGICDFYRKLYNVASGQPCLRIENEDDWHALPHLTREHLSDTPMEDRIFVPLSEVDIIGASSGTSGKPPLFSARSESDGYAFVRALYDFERAPLSPISTYYRGTGPLGNDERPRGIIIDARSPAATVRLARAVGIDSLIANANQLRSIGKEMKRQGLADRIRFVNCGGGSSSSVWDYMRNTFPHAAIYYRYGASEVDASPLGIPCRALSKTDGHDVYHPNADIHFDIIDPETGADIVIERDIEAEVLITGVSKTSPLIRYRIGDRIRIVDTVCEVHGTWSFTVIGRSDTDFVKILGGMLRVDEVDRVLKQFQDRVTGEFELHYAEENVLERSQLRVRLFIDPKGPTDWEQIAEEIADVLRVGPVSTYADGVARGFYFPLVCAPLPPQQDLKKRRRIVRDDAYDKLTS